jgi:hypothetical protein
VVHSCIGLRYRLVLVLRGRLVSGVVVGIVVVVAAGIVGLMGLPVVVVLVVVVPVDKMIKLFKSCGCIWILC